MSCVNLLKRYLYERVNEGEGFVHKGELERVAMDHGFLGDQASRRLRELSAQGEIERRAKGKSIEYKYIVKFAPEL